MAHRQTSDLLRPVDGDFDAGIARLARTPPRCRAECLEQILRAFRDIADRDDIHQAAERLALAQEWIRTETERAANDPIFVDLRLV